MAEHRSFRPLEAFRAGALAAVAKLFEELEANVPWLHGRVLTAEFTVAGGTTMALEHGLGRRYAGGWQLSGELARRFDLYAPSIAEDNNVNPDTHVYIGQGGAAANNTVTLWVY